MTAPNVLRYGQDVCQNWNTDALRYGVDYANSRWPGCINGVRQATVAAPNVPPPPVAPPTSTTGGTGSTPAPAEVGGGRCRSCGPSTAAINPNPAAPPVTGNIPKLAQPKPDFPWWVWILAALTLAQVVSNE